MRAKGVTNAPNAVLHPWLQDELAQVLATLPPSTSPEDERPPLARWATWLGHAPTELLPLILDDGSDPTALGMHFSVVCSKNPSQAQLDAATAAAEIAKLAAQ